MVELVIRRKLSWAKVGRRKDGVVSGQIYEGTALVQRSTAIWAPGVL